MYDRFGEREYLDPRRGEYERLRERLMRLRSRSRSRERERERERERDLRLSGAGLGEHDLWATSASLRLKLSGWQKGQLASTDHTSAWRRLEQLCSIRREG